jgi:D-serine deaminase-like pyridoxal phosphate-dependent protein
MVDAFLDFMRREHGVGDIAGGDDVSDGERLQAVPLHVCSCVNLFEMAFGMRGDRVDHEIAIQARGCVR